MVTQNLDKFTTPVFPFTAIVGQEEMKLALQLNVIDPKIGGVMIMGDRGTGKSTTIRAVADLLPAIQVAADDPFNSSITDFELMSEKYKKMHLKKSGLQRRATGGCCSAWNARKYEAKRQNVEESS